jgi:ABC-type oligopeptide transport system ATPase subunit
MSKISESELKSLQEQEQKKSAILHDLGLLQTQVHSLNHMYVELMVEQQKSKQELEESYGKVNINLQDGSFELIEEKDEENK